jgi:hypothetical protein
MKRSLILAALSAVALCGGGCTSTTITDPKTGFVFKRTSLLSSQSIGTVDVRTGGDTGVKIEGLQQNQTEMAGAMLAAAVKAASKP